MANLSKCIYCHSDKELWARSHTLPEGLGTFENQVTLHKKVCQRCEHETGRCEEQLLRCGPEAFLRIALGIQTSTKPFRRRFSGQGPLKFKARYPNTDYYVLVEPIPNTHNTEPLPQIVIVPASGECEQILVTETDITAQEIEERIRATGIKGEVTLWPIASTEEEQIGLFELLKQSQGFRGIEGDGDILPSIEKVDVIGTITVDRRYFRAIAKIAFHYFVAYNEEFGGSESCFEPIRRFVRYDEGDTDAFVHQKRGNLVQELNMGYRPKHYGHFLIGFTGRESIRTSVQLFIGKDIDPPYYDVLLGENPRRIWRQNRRFGHFYAYHEPEKRTQFAGTMIRLHEERFIKIVHGLILPFRPKRRKRRIR